MPNPSTLGTLDYLGVVSVLFGFLLILAGIEIVQFEKLHVSTGRKTWVTGVVLVIVGAGILVGMRVPSVRTQYLLTETPPVVEAVEEEAVEEEVVEEEAVATATLIPEPTSTHIPTLEPKDAVALSADSTSTGQPTQKIASIPTAGQDTRIKTIRERGNILIAGVKFDFKPFGYLDDNDQVIGFDVDLIKAMADEWGVEVEFVPVTSDNRMIKLLNNEVDILAASMTHEKNRAEKIDFSQTYFFDGQSLLVRENSGIANLLDLDGKIVAALQGSTSIENIRAEVSKRGLQIDLRSFREPSQMIDMLRTGQVDAFTSDSVMLSQYAHDNPGLIVVGGLFTEEPYGLGLPPGDSHFRDVVNFTLQKSKEDGGYNRIYEKWFGRSAVPYDVEIAPGEWPVSFDASPTTIEVPASKVRQILEKGSFTAGVRFDFEPFGYLDEGKQLVGFDVDLMREFARRWLGDENAVEFVEVTSASRLSKLVDGEVDIVAAAMTWRKERDVAIDFSQTYFLDGQSLLVREGSGINGLSDLDGKVVAALEGSTSLENIPVAVEQQAALDGKEITIGIFSPPFATYGQALQALEEGYVDVFTSDRAALSRSAQANPKLVVVGGQFTREPYGLGIPQNDKSFRDLVNFTLQEMKMDGTYDAIYCRWFANDYVPYDLEIWPSEPPLTQYQGVNLKRNGPAFSNPCLDETFEEPEANPHIVTDNAIRYVVVEGDSLSKIAENFYGDVFLWGIIYEDNRDIIGDDPGQIEIGTELRIRKSP